jgi:iron complex transport system ATP-binding protein
MCAGYCGVQPERVVCDPDAVTYALELTNVRVVRGDTVILHDVTWRVADGERWIVLGANGSGKTTLVRIASMYLHPSGGTVDVLGARLGRVDVRRHRRKIGVVSSSFADLLRPTLSAVDIVMTAKNAALEPWWHEYDDGDRARATELLDRFGCGELASHPFATLSSGERQRVQLARTLMTEPGLLLLDEPTAGLDLGGREDLVSRLASLAADPATPATILVTHHVDEIPAGFGHVLLLRDGRVQASGPIDDVLTADALSECFGVKVVLERRGGRFFAYSSE